jgi:hypothetical protein
LKYCLPAFLSKGFFGSVLVELSGGSPAEFSPIGRVAPNALGPAFL